MAYPLQSLKVLDLSTLLPGPFATKVLADMGAEVLRVEAATRPDFSRTSEPRVGEHSASHCYLGRSKRSIALDLKRPEAVELVKQLVIENDIFVEQFRPGVMKRLGLDYETLKQINPKLIYCSITGYGQTGPYKDRAGHDINYLSIAGLSSYSGYQNSGPPPMGIQIADVAGGSHYAVMGILAAVIHRSQTGEGQYIDISMTDTAFALNAMYGAGYLACGEEPQPERLLLNGGSFYGYYQTADGRFFSVGGLEPQFLSTICDVLNRPELAEIGMNPDPEKQNLLKRALQEMFLSKDFEEWVTVFSSVDACVEPVLTLAEAANHPHIRERGMVVEVASPEGGIPQAACPIKFSTLEASYKYAGSNLGGHTLEVLAELGLDDSQVNYLREIGTFG